MNPNHELTAALYQNISTMATQFNHPDSIAYIKNKRQHLILYYKRSAPPRAKKEKIELTLNEIDDSEIVQALLEYGFCVIRQSCDPSAIEAIKAYLTTELQAPFPASFDARILQLIAPLYRFDPPTIMAKAFDGPVALNKAACVARKVFPDNTHSQTPFHQDVSAFLAPVINVWTPLTGSGDDFPSIEFVRKRIDQVEETILTAGQYNQVEIDEASVLQRYGKLLYEYKSPTPGDCVIFLGSTIHRTSNIRAATKDRLSLEVRYSLSTR